MALFWASNRNCQEIIGKGQKLPQTCPKLLLFRALRTFLGRHSYSSALLPLSLLDFEDSDGDSKGSQEPDKQLTSPEVMARSNSSD